MLGANKRMMQKSSDAVFYIDFEIFLTIFQSYLTSEQNSKQLLEHTHRDYSVLFEIACPAFLM